MIQFDLIRDFAHQLEMICKHLLIDGHMETLKLLMRRYCSKGLQERIIREMMEQDKKKAAAIMLEMDFATDSDLYKMVYSTLMKNCAKFMLYSNTKQKPESSTYNSLQKIESMLEGYDDVMAYYIE